MPKMEQVIPVESVALATPPPLSDMMESLIADDGEDTTNPRFKYNYKRTKLQREEDLATIARLLSQKMSVPAIAQHISSTRPYRIGRTQVQHDIAVLDERLKHKFMRRANIYRARELEDLDYLEREAYEGMERSKAEEMSIKVETVDDEDGKSGKKKPTKTTREKRKRDGDPAWIRTILMIKERRAKLMGLDAPTEVKQEINARVEHGADIESLRAAYRRRVLGEVGSVRVDPPTNPENRAA